MHSEEAVFWNFIDDPFCSGYQNQQHSSCQWAQLNYTNPCDLTKYFLGDHEMMLDEEIPNLIQPLQEGPLSPKSWLHQSAFLTVLAKAGQFVHKLQIGNKFTNVMSKLNNGLLAGFFIPRSTKWMEPTAKEDNFCQNG